MYDKIIKIALLATAFIFFMLSGNILGEQKQVIDQSRTIMFFKEIVFDNQTGEDFEECGIEISEGENLPLDFSEAEGIKECLKREGYLVSNCSSEIWKITK